MIEKLYFSHYRLSLSPIDLILMPRLGKGNVLRGAFGSSLKGILCAVQKGNNKIECVDCLVRDRCPYALIFNPVGLVQAKRLQNPPRGYIIKPPLDPETQYDSSKPLVFDMVLVGDRNNFLPYLIVSFKELGQRGLGLNRGKFNLAEIEIVKNAQTISIYDSSSNTVKNIDGTVHGGEIIARAKTFHTQRVILRFLTPTRIKYNPTGEKGKGEVVRVPEFHHLIRRLRDRINALCVTYCGGPIEIDFKGMAERAKSVGLRSANIHWVERKRKGYHDQSGFIGEMEFEGDFAEYLPLLIAGQYLHVGEDAVFGHGWYEIQGLAR